MQHTVVKVCLAYMKVLPNIAISLSAYLNMAQLCVNPYWGGAQNYKSELKVRLARLNISAETFLKESGIVSIPSKQDENIHRI